MKEYHIWDGIYIPECRKFITRKEHGLRHILQTVDGAYEKYFASLIDDGISLTGDFTPSYSGLPAECFHLLRRRLESEGFDLKIVFLMRDPFERCWSSVRMGLKNKTLEGAEFDLLKNLYRSNGYIFRTNYPKTIKTLESVFDPKKIYYGIFEELFDYNNLKNLTNFVGVQFRPEFVEKRINISPKSDNQALLLKSEIISFYADVYRFCFDRFPQTKMLWNSPAD